MCSTFLDTKSKSNQNELWMRLERGRLFLPLFPHCKDYTIIEPQLSRWENSRGHIFQSDKKKSFVMVATPHLVSAKSV